MKLTVDFFYRVTYIVFFIWSLNGSKVLAQNSIFQPQYQAVTGVLNASFFNGDVASGPTNIRPGLGIGYFAKMNGRLSYTCTFQYIRLVGDDVSNSNPGNPMMINLYIRNLHFRNDVLELAGQMRFDLFSNHEHFRKRPAYNIYLSTGIGLIYHNPQAKDSSGFWIPLRGVKTENVSYSPVSMVIPVGIGVRYKWNNFIDIELELSYRITTSDYLDDVKGSYVSTSDISDPTGKYMSNRSSEGVNRFNDSPRDLNYIKNTLGETVVLSPDGYSYIASQGPGTARGTQFGPDGYLLFQLRLCYILQDRAVNCPRYR
jgi:hypothetical protein